MNELFRSQEYNGWEYDPPMPVLDIGISKPGTDAPGVFLEAIVDTGADGTLLPTDALKEVGAPLIDRVSLIGVTGQRQKVDLYVVTLHLGDLRIHGIKAAALAEGSPAILGRDALNQLQIYLNGPAQIIEVLK